MNDTSAPGVAPELRPRLQGLVCGILGRGTSSVPAEAALSELGMSSIKMVNLMLAVEAEFDLSIPQQDITPANFRSLASVEALLRRLLNRG